MFAWFIGHNAWCGTKKLHYAPKRMQNWNFHNLASTKFGASYYHCIRHTFMDVKLVGNTPLSDLGERPLNWKNFLSSSFYCSVHVSLYLHPSLFIHLLSLSSIFDASFPSIFLAPFHRSLQIACNQGRLTHHQFVLVTFFTLSRCSRVKGLNTHWIRSRTSR